jgi:RimJ/RimL family protein N-acetyltransferase
MHYMPGQFESLQDYLDRFEAARADPKCLTFVVADKRGPPEAGLPGAIAGHIGYLRSDFPHLCTEIGLVITLPAYQRTHVTSNAVGLLLQYALHQPNHASAPGMGMRRVEWRTHHANAALAACTRAGEGGRGAERGGCTEGAKGPAHAAAGDDLGRVGGPGTQTCRRADATTNLALV